MQGELVDSSTGEMELDVGSWALMLERASGVKATYIGKPSPYVFDLALKTMNLRKEGVLVAAYRIDSDIKGAQNAIIRSVLIKTGESDKKDLKDGSNQTAFWIQSGNLRHWWTDFSNAQTHL